MEECSMIKLIVVLVHLETGMNNEVQIADSINCFKSMILHLSAEMGQLNISTQWLVVGICIQVLLLVNLVCSFDAHLDGLIFELDADGTKHRL